jgi:hypothetical protein
MITLEQYLTQHAQQGAAPPAVIDAATNLLAKVHALLEVSPVPDPDLRSGWRPPGVNLAVGGAHNSQHMTGHAIDVADNTGLLDSWLTDEILEKYGLYREAPESTPSWTHLQDIAPSSGRRTFIPRTLIV